MSVTTELQTIPPGSLGFVSDVWDLKERIRKETGYLQQNKSFFRDAYQRTTAHVLLEDDSPVGFISVQDDGYILLLGVDPAAHENGYGRRLIEHITEHHRSLTCHARVENASAVAFYKQLGFEITHMVEDYYGDKEDAYYLIRKGDRDDLWDQWRD